MLKFVIRRSLQAVVTLFVLSVLLFAWLRSLPGGPVSALLGERGTEASRAALTAALGMTTRTATVPAAELAAWQHTATASGTTVADLLSALSTDRDLLDAQTRARDVAAENARLASLGYENGAGSLIQVIDARRQYQRAQLASIDAQALLRADIAALFVATASDWRA